MTSELVPDELWLAPRQAKQKIGVHTKTLQRWGEAGLITMIILPNNRRRYLSSDIDAILEAREAVT